MRKIYTDKISGDKEERPGIKQALEYERKGDIIVVWRSSWKVIKASH